MASIWASQLLLLLVFSFNVVTSYKITELGGSDSGWSEYKIDTKVEDDDWDQFLEYDDYYYSISASGPRRETRGRVVMLPNYNYMGLPRPTFRNTCFPGSARVTLEDGSTISMAQLQVGHKLLTGGEDGELVYSEVQTFLKRDPDELSRYLVIWTQTGANITLSDTHVIFINNNNNNNNGNNNNNNISTIFASEVEVGDQVLVHSGGGLTPQTVTRIYETALTGVYVPLTEHGTVLVDDVLASCYASFDHQLAHTFLAPLRWWPSLFGWARLQDDMPAYVYAIKELGHILLPSVYQSRLPTLEQLLLSLSFFSFM